MASFNFDFKSLSEIWQLPTRESTNFWWKVFLPTSESFRRTKECKGQMQTKIAGDKERRVWWNVAVRAKGWQAWHDVGIDDGQWELEFVWPYRKWGIFISSSFSVLGSIFLSSHHKSEWWWQAHFSPDCWVYFSYPPPQIFDRLRKNVTSLMLYAFAFLYLYIHTIWIATFCMPNFHISYSLITMSRKQSTKLKWSYINLFISLFFFYDSMEALVTEDFQWLGCFGPWVSYV